LSDGQNSILPNENFAQNNAPADRSSILAIEEDLWNTMLEKPEEPNGHNAYFSFVTRNNLLKEASRRYGAIVLAKDDYSIDARRQFREYQKNIINLMFMTDPRDITLQKGSSLDLFAFLAITIMTVFGFVMIFYEKTRLFGMGMFLVGIGVLAYLIVAKIKKVSDKIDKGNPAF
jgi:hypothetical protein